MELAHDDVYNILCAKWSDELGVESPEFFQTITSLFVAIQEKQITDLMIDSGIPAGGVLTEKLIDLFIQNTSNTPLQNIAILESSDYLWDYNLYQVIKLLVAKYELPITVKLVKSRAEGLQWFKQLAFAE